MKARDDLTGRDGQLQPPYLPQQVADLDIAFPARALELMPTWAAIPDEFAWNNDDNSWVKLAHSWFNGTLPAGGFVPKPGVDAQIAGRHLRVVLGTFSCKHEHKIAALAYLMSLWFESFLTTEELEARFGKDEPEKPADPPLVFTKGARDLRSGQWIGDWDPDEHPFVRTEYGGFNCPCQRLAGDECPAIAVESARLRAEKHA